jgi:nitrite reductase/ring-hydroxylating ferredoxin subunit
MKFFFGAITILAAAGLTLLTQVEEVESFQFQSASSRSSSSTTSMLFRKSAGSTSSSSTSTTTSTTTTINNNQYLQQQRKKHSSFQNLMSQNHIALSSAVTSDDAISTDSSSTPQQPAEQEEGIGAWIPLGSAKGLEGLGPQRIRLMGIDLVVWHTTGTAPNNDNSNTDNTDNTDKKKNKKSSKGSLEKEELIWTAQVDACTHRLAPLSQGRVNPKTNCIECPYHGWNFDTDGTVQHIPQLEPNKSITSIQTNQGGNIQTFPVHQVHDLLFVFLPSSLHGEMFPQSLLPEEWYPHLSNQLKDGKQIFVRDLPYSFDFLVENFMDPAHIPFAHHKLQSTRDDGIPIPIDELVSNFTHVEASFRDVTAKRPRDGYASFQRPSCYHFGEYNGDDGVDEASGKPSKVPKLCIWLAPIEAGASRVFFVSPPIKVPTFLLHAGSNRFLNSDTWLHDNEREVIKRKEAGLKGVEKKLAGMDYIYASQSDRGVSIFRKWWKNNGMADAPAHTFGMATMKQLENTQKGGRLLSRREQIDPWEGHTKHCSSCRKSLRYMKKGQHVLLFLALGSGVLGGGLGRGRVVAPLLGMVGAGVCLYGRNFLKKFATALEGNPEVSGVNDRSASASAD